MKNICGLCDRSFYRKSNLRNHIRMKHPEIYRNEDMNSTQREMESRNSDTKESEREKQSDNTYSKDIVPIEVLEKTSFLKKWEFKEVLLRNKVHNNTMVSKHTVQGNDDENVYNYTNIDEEKTSEESDKKIMMVMMNMMMML